MSVGCHARLPRLLGAIGFAALPGCMTAPLPAEGLTARPLDVTASQVAQNTEPPPRPVNTPARIPGTPLPLRLRVPAELPGAEIPLLQIPPADPNDRTAFEKAIAELFPAPPPLPPDPVPTEGP